MSLLRIGFDETGLVFELSQAEVNTFTEPILANFIAGTGEEHQLWYHQPQWSVLHSPIYLISDGGLWCCV